DNSDDERLPKNSRYIEKNDEENGVTHDADSQDDEDQNAEGGQLDEGAMEDVHLVPGHTQAC
ncbi:hypothetical protein CRENBAI_013599, partial [Crenichthys baileyi]